MITTMKISSDHQTKTYLNSKFTFAEKAKLTNKIARLYINEELVNFIREYIEPFSKKDKLTCLIWFERTVAQTYRSPDLDHYAAFSDLYDQELSAIALKQKFYEPIRWLQAEIKYVTNSVELLSVKDVQRELSIMQEAKQRLSKDWLSFKEVMQLFSVSKSTLHRRVANGMPCHKKDGKAVYFFLNEINEYMRSGA